MDDITKISLENSSNAYNEGLQSAISLRNSIAENFDVNSSLEIQEALRSADEAILRAQQMMAEAAQAQAQAQAMIANASVTAPVVQDITPISLSTGAEIAEIQRIQLEQQAAQAAELQMQQQIAQQTAAQAAQQQSLLDAEPDIIQLDQLTNATSASNVTAPITPGYVSGSISPGTSQSTFAAQSYNLDPATYNELVALVYSEASERPDFVTSDTMAVTSSILNRLESGRYGSSIHDVISSPSQYSGYHNHKFNSAMNNQGVVKPEMIAAINRVLNGERNTIARSFSGNGVHNSFR